MALTLDATPLKVASLCDSIVTISQTIQQATQPATQQTSVVIVGAGPTGLMLALQLAEQRIPFVLIDANAGPSIATKALVVQARTMEIYQRMGLAARALAVAQPVDAANIHIGGRAAVRLPLAQLGQGISPFPRLTALTQDQNEHLLGERLRELGGSVQWQHRLIGIEQSSDGARAAVQTPDGQVVTVTADWVAGCDGAHSAVRHLCAIDFPGAPYQQVFYVADVQARGPMTAGELTIFLWSDEFHFFFPMQAAGAEQSHYRLIGVVPTLLRQVDDLKFEDLSDAIHKRMGGQFVVSQVNWFSPYRIHHRRADRFSSGRCFLLGDAAHIHSPAGGQGMNTGLQDAFNLGWKLALVCHGQAAATLLDSYAAERIPVAERLLKTTDRAFAAITSPSRLAQALRTRIAFIIAKTLMQLTAVQRLAFRIISQTAISYRHSPISVNSDAVAHRAPHAGDRMPWLQLRLNDEIAPSDLYLQMSGSCFHLILWRQDSASVAELHALTKLQPNLLKILLIQDAPGNAIALKQHAISGPCALLVRPDGYIGFTIRHVSGAALQHYFEDVLRVRLG